MSLDHWYFDKETLKNTPSRTRGITEDKEQAYLQKTANFIQEMARKLALPLICINTAVLFTQRFYVFHPITLFEKFSMAASAVFLAAKVEEHPRKVDHVCQIAKMLGIVKKGVKDADYCQELLFNENVLLQTLGFEVLVQHPHQHVLRLCELFQAGKPLSQTSYLLATYCLHLTRMCLIYKPVYIACLCIYMACKCTNWEIPLSREGRHWYTYGDPDITEELLESMCEEFLNLLKQCPEICKKKTLTATHENLVKKLFLHTTGLPIVKEGDQNIGKMDPIPSTSTCESSNDIEMSEPNQAAKEALPVSCQVMPTKSNALPPMEIYKYDSLSNEVPQNVSHSEKLDEKNTAQPMEIQKQNPLPNKVPKNVLHSEKISQKITPQPMETQKYKVPQRVMHSENPKPIHKITPQPTEVQKLYNRVPQKEKYFEKLKHNQELTPQTQKYKLLSNKIPHKETHTPNITPQAMEVYNRDPQKEKYFEKLKHNQELAPQTQNYKPLPNKIPHKETHTPKFTPQTMEIQKYDTLSHHVPHKDKHYEKLKPNQKITPQSMQVNDSFSNKVLPKLTINDLVNNSFKHSLTSTSALSSLKTDKTNYGRLSQSTSLIPKPAGLPPQVPPLKLSQVKSYDELIQNKPNQNLKMTFKIPKTNSIFDAHMPKVSSSNSLKITIPKSRLTDYNNPAIFHQSAATVADVKADKMAYTLTPASMGNQIERNKSKKFKPN